MNDTAAQAIDLHARRPWRARIQVGGFQPFSTIDWPGAIAAVIFLRGCPWRCGYCHNPDLQQRRGPAPLDWPSVEAELVRRQGWLDGVVFSGGEPTADRALPDAIARVRELGYRVGLHTGGAYPERFAALLPQLDWVGFDIKADAANYDSLTSVRGSGLRAMHSARLLAASGVNCEFRMTFHSGLLDQAAVLRAADMLGTLGVREFVLQEYRSDGVSSETLPAHTGLPAALLETLRGRFAKFTLRPAH